MMKTTKWPNPKLPALLCLATCLHLPAAPTAPALRPPSVPLVACDPYFSIWSPADKLTDTDTVHWTGKANQLRSVLRIDGQDYRVMGAGAPGEAVMEQKGVTVLPTRTIYAFEGAGVALTLTFMTPALPDDLMVYSRPLTYVTYDLHSVDGKTHAVVIGLGAFATIAVNEPKQQVVLSLPAMGDGLRVAKVGSLDQAILGKKGDDLRIDWGYLYLAAPEAQHAQVRTQPEIGVGANTCESKAQGAVVSVQFDDVSVSAKPVSRWLMLAYDDEYSIQYFKQNLRPYWRRNGDDGRRAVEEGRRGIRVAQAAVREVRRMM